MTTVAIIARHPEYKTWTEEYGVLREEVEKKRLAKWDELKNLLRSNDHLPEGYTNDWQIELDREAGTILVHEPHSCADCGDPQVISGKLPKEIGELLANLFKSAKSESAKL